MRRDLIFPGILGLVVGLAIFLAANWVKAMIPVILPSFILAFVTFAAVLLITLMEMPIMVFVLCKMAQSTMPRTMIRAGFAIYTMFSAVYGSIQVLLTDGSYLYFGVILASFGILRFCSGIWIK